MSLLKVYNAQHEFDMMCTSEAYLYSSFSDHYPRLNLPDYNVTRAGKPKNTSKGGVCVYFKESSTVCLVMSPYLKKYLSSQVFIQNRKIYMVLSYRSPCETQDQLNNFLINTE